MKKFGKSRSGKKRKSIRFASCERRLNIVLDVTCENQRDFSAARRILDMQQPESSFFFFFFPLPQISHVSEQMVRHLVLLLRYNLNALSHWCFLIISSPFLRSTRTGIIWEKIAPCESRIPLNMGKLRRYKPHNFIENLEIKLKRLIIFQTFTFSCLRGFSFKCSIKTLL